MRLLLLIHCILLSACSTVETHEVKNYGAYDDAYQSVRVYTPGVEGAACHLSNISAQYELVAPNVVTIERSGLPLDIVCTKGSHFSGAVRLEPKTIVLDETRIAYVYPASVSVPMGINPISFTKDLTIF